LLQFVLVSPDATDYRTLWEALILFVLYLEPTPHTVPATTNFLRESFRFGSLTEAAIAEHLEKLVLDGKVHRTQHGRWESYDLAPDVREEMRGDLSRAKQARSKLLNYVFDRATTNVRVDTGTIRDLRTAVDRFFALFLESRTVASLANLPDLPDLRGDIFYLQCIELSARTIRSQELRQRYSKALSDAVQEDVFRDYLWDTLRRYVSMCVMRVQPSAGAFSEVFFDSSSILLDTNVIISLMLSSETQHRVATSVCDYMHVVGFDVRVTAETLHEFYQVFDVANRLPDRDRADTKHENPFIRDYARKEAQQLACSWDDYCLQVRTRLDPELTRFGIVRDDTPLDSLLADAEFANAQQAIGEAVTRLKRRKGPDALRHDALLISYVLKIRTEQSHDRRARTILLTADLTLYLACKLLGRTVETKTPSPAVMVDVWLQTLALFPLRGPEVSRNLLRDAARAVSEFLTSEYTQVLPPFTRPELAKLLKPLLASGQYPPHYLLERAEEKILVDWLADPQNRLVDEALSDAKREALRIRTETELSRRIEKEGDVHREMATIRKRERTKNALLSVFLLVGWVLVARAVWDASWVKSQELEVRVGILGAMAIMLAAAIACVWGRYGWAKRIGVSALSLLKWIQSWRRPSGGD
jgi:hypothetical protein